MQFVKTSDLKPGMRLAKPIYNKMGVLLYERNTKLTIQGINSIENFGLIGIFILEPAEPLPPLTREDVEFEQFQTIYMFKLKDNMDKLQDSQPPATLLELAQSIQAHYGVLDHKLNFAQMLRSSADFVYKHSISVAILTALISNGMRVTPPEKLALIIAGLLYDFGYLYVPLAVLDKGDDLTDSDQDFIQMNLERGYETIRPTYESCGLPKLSLEIIQQVIFENSRNVKPKEPVGNVRLLADILKVADKFDRLTAMRLSDPPVSEVAAMYYLKKNSRFYNSRVLTALAQCIHILPTGSCVDLSDGEKALVLMENPDDFARPMVLKFSNNLIYDLSDPMIGKKLRVKDTMKTMDNRIAIDADTLNHFSADGYIKETTDRFRKSKLQIAQRRQSGAAQRTSGHRGTAPGQRQPTPGQAPRQAAGQQAAPGQPGQRQQAPGQVPRQAVGQAPRQAAGQQTAMGQVPRQTAGQQTAPGQPARQTAGQPGQRQAAPGQAPRQQGLRQPQRQQ